MARHDKEIEPSRVLREDEMDDWLELQEPYLGGHSEGAPHRVPAVDAVLQGIAPPGFNNQKIATLRPCIRQFSEPNPSLKR